MGWFNRLFGYEGKLRIEYTTIDDRIFTCTINVSSFGMTFEEMKPELANVIFVETGKRVKDMKLLGYT